MNLSSNGDLTHTNFTATASNGTAPNFDFWNGLSLTQSSDATGQKTWGVSTFWAVSLPLTVVTIVMPLTALAVVRFFVRNAALIGAIVFSSTAILVFLAAYGAMITTFVKPSIRFWWVSGMNCLVLLLVSLNLFAYAIRKFRSKTYKTGLAVRLALLLYAAADEVVLRFVNPVEIGYGLWFALPLVLNAYLGFWIVRSFLRRRTVLQQRSDD